MYFVEHVLLTPQENMTYVNFPIVGYRNQVVDKYTVCSGPECEVLTAPEGKIDLILSQFSKCAVTKLQPG